MTAPEFCAPPEADLVLSLAAVTEAAAFLLPVQNFGAMMQEQFR
jgi:hypothetical protein